MAGNGQNVLEGSRSSGGEREGREREKGNQARGKEGREEGRTREELAVNQRHLRLEVGIFHGLGWFRRVRWGS